MLHHYIQAERLHDWLSHLSLTKQMINIFAVTGHRNYAKTCRLYVQSAMSLERGFLYLYPQFLEGNYTLRRIEKPFSGIWIALSIKKVLMRSFKGR